MKSHSHPIPSPGSLTRRSFLGQTTLGTLATLASLSPTVAAPRERTAAVIGHTGRGDYGHGLERVFLNRPGVRIVAVADPDARARERVASMLGAPRHYANYREMLQQEKPDLVSIAMRHADQHHEIGLAALRAGAHIYCEKPFTTFPAESDDLLAAARERRLKIAVAHTMRMTPVMVRFKRAMESGLIGDLIEMRAHGKQDARAGGEDMMVLGTHLFDLMRMFAGDPLSCSARVLWKGGNITGNDRRIVRDHVGFVAGDQVFAQFAFPGGVHATFTSSGGLRETIGHWGIEFLGSQGVARVNCDITPNVFVRSTTGWSPSGRTDTWEPLDADLTASPPNTISLR